MGPYTGGQFHSWYISVSDSLINEDFIRDRLLSKSTPRIGVLAVYQGR